MVDSNRSELFARALDAARNSGDNTIDLATLREVLDATGESGPTTTAFGWSEDPAIPEPTVLPVPDRTRGFRVLLTLENSEPYDNEIDENDGADSDLANQIIWRRLEVPGDITLPELHGVIQLSMGWADCHLHQFRTGPGYRAPAFLNDFAVADGEPGLAETGIRLDQLVRAENDALWYEYDFGDSWSHRLSVEAVLDDPPAAVSCTAAQCACPPEDCGGTPGYLELAQWARAGFDDAALPEGFSDPEHARTWLPAGWHPDHVELAAINRDLATLAVTPVLITGEFADLTSRITGHTRAPLGALLRSPAFAAAATEPPSAAEAAALTEQFRIFLDVIGAGTLLTAAGRLKPAVVRELAERLGVTEWWIGACNREDQTSPVANVRDVARKLGLVTVRKGLLLPTAVAGKCAGDPVALMRHIASRLPLGTEQSEREAGWLSLVVIGADVPPAAWKDSVSRLLFDAGWRSAAAPQRPPSASNLTLTALSIMNGSNCRPGDLAAAPGLAALARAAVTAG